MSHLDNGSKPRHPLSRKKPILKLCVLGEGRWSAVQWWEDRAGSTHRQGCLRKPTVQGFHVLRNRTSDFQGLLEPPRVSQPVVSGSLTFPSNSPAHQEIEKRQQEGENCKTSFTRLPQNLASPAGKLKFHFLPSGSPEAAGEKGAAESHTHTHLVPHSNLP